MEQMNIVQLTTQDVTKAMPVTTSQIVAGKYEVSHISVVKLIEKYESDFTEFGNLTSFQMTRAEKQRTERAYELNEQQFYLLVTFMKNTEIGRHAKKQFVKAFMIAKSELTARQNTRHIGVTLRHSLTDSIKNHVADGSNFKKFAYSNYTKLVYKKVLGADVKKSKEARGLKETDNLRDFLTISELETVQALESKIAAFIEVSDTQGKDDKQIYQMVKAYLDNQPQIA
jgi:phage regulator Rha-like protein